MMAFSQISDINYHIRETNKSYQFIEGESPGVYAGIGSEILGLTGEVEELTFIQLMKGIHPITKEYLYQTNGKKHRPGFDIVFNAPKEVSVAWARSNRKQREMIEDAHYQAVVEALRFIERHAAYTRRGHNGVTHQKVVGLIAALFQHSTSRAEDPHLHTHCVIMNTAQRFDKGYGSLESMHILRYQKAASYLYKAKISEQLRELGYGTQTISQSFAINGIPNSLCEHFSKRRRQILGALEAKGVSTARAANMAAKMTRGIKKSVNRSKLFNSWQSEMNEYGFTEQKLKELQDFSLGIHIPDEDDLTLIKFNKEFISELLTESVSVFSEIDIFNAALYTAMRLAIPAKAALDLAEVILESEQIIELVSHKDYERVFTTHDMRELERQLITDAQLLKNRSFISGLSINDIKIAEHRTGLNLSEEQEEALLGVLGDASLEIMCGSAGSGKSTTMTVVADIYRSKGIRVWGAAIAKTAAKNLEQETSVTSFTIAKLLLDLDNNWSKIKRGDLVIIDESGQVGVKHLFSLQTHAIKKGFKIILTGDDRQLKSIEHSGALSFLIRKNVLGSTRINQIRRQRQQWDRAAVANFRDGKSTEGLLTYKKYKRIHLLQDIESAYLKIVEDWDNYRKENPEKQTMVIARTWDDVIQLNELIRNKLQKNDEVEKQDIEINGVVGSKEFNFLLSVNDRIRFTRNNSQLGFTNGDIGIINNISKDNNGEISIAVKRDDGQSINIKQSSYSDDKGNLFVVPAYAQTIYSSQGQTIDGNVFVLHDQMIDRAHAYVALSRHKDECHLYVSKEDIIDEDMNLPQHKTIDDTVLAKIAFQYQSEKRGSLSIEYDRKEQFIKEAPLYNLQKEIEFE
jgi:conjugative relaxase-like TrwC/TraI family protein